MVYCEIAVQRPSGSNFPACAVIPADHEGTFHSANTLANKGLVPAFPRTLTRFEFDPVATGKASAANIVDRLAGRTTGPIFDVVSYIVGESFPLPKNICPKNN